MLEVTTEESQQKTKRQDNRFSQDVLLLFIFNLVMGFLHVISHMGPYPRRAWIAETKSNLENAATAQQSYFAMNNSYMSCVSCTSSELPEYDKRSKVTLRAETGTTGFVLTATHKYCEGEWTYQSTTGEVTIPSPEDGCDYKSWRGLLSTRFSP